MQQSRACTLLIILSLSFILACGKKADDVAGETQTLSPSSFAVAPQSIEPLMPAGVARAFERSCKSCHGPAGHGIAAIAPDLRKAKTRTVEQWTQYLTTTHSGAMVPPPTWVNADEINAMANYLVALHGPSLSPPGITEEDKSSR